MVNRSLPDDTGAVALFIAVMMLALLSTVGLVLVGGQKVDALREATNIADNAARAGAQRADLGMINAGGPATLIAGEAIAAAHRYLTRVGHSGTATVTGDTITVTVSITFDPALLPIGPVTVSATESASVRLEEGP